MRPRAIHFAFAAALALAPACARSRDGEVVGTDHSADTGGMGYCRTTTCTPPAGYPSADGACEPEGWSESDTCTSQRESNAPLWWSTSCVGYDLNRAASRGVPYDVFSAATQSAFAAWTDATCPVAGGSSRVSIDVRDLGAIDCAKATYDPDGPNQNVIVFHDDAWPHEVAAPDGSHPKSLVIALTTVSYDPVTGQIYDADIELNSADYAIAPVVAGAPESAPAGAFDLQAILTHEIGHLFGLAHSPLEAAVMNASGDSDSSSPKRSLRAEDVRGLCAIYPADETRSVSTLVDPSGSAVAGTCDPTPRHGFSSTCK